MIDGWFGFTRKCKWLHDMHVLGQTRPQRAKIIQFSNICTSYIHEHLVYIAMHLSKPSFPWGPDVVRLLVINSALLYLVVNFYYLQEELWCMLLDLAI
jgi:hypothetical protein